jgi:hypothetical protein
MLCHVELPIPPELAPDVVVMKHWWTEHNDELRKITNRQRGQSDEELVTH